MSTFKVGDRIFDRECPDAYGTIKSIDRLDYEIQWDNGNLNWSSSAWIAHLDAHPAGLTVEQAVRFLSSQGFKVTIVKETK